MKELEVINWQKVGVTAGLGIAGYFVARKFVNKSKMATIGGLLVGGAIGFFGYDMVFKKK